MRLPFFLDNFIGWLIPTPVINVFYSMHWPFHIASAILVIFFWLELTSQSNVQTQAGFLTTRRWPAAIIIILVTIAEFTTSAVRAAGGSTSALIFITAYAAAFPCRPPLFLTFSKYVYFSSNSALYIIILLSCAIIYFVVYFRVRRFLLALPSLGSNQKLLLKVSIRFFLTAFTFLMLVIMAIMSALSFYSEALGQSIVHFGIYLTLNLGSTLMILAFKVKLSKTMTGGSSKHTSKTVSGGSHVVSKSSSST